MSHFGLARALWEALALLFRACRSFLMLMRLAKRFIVDQVDAMVFGVHCERCRSSARLCALCVSPCDVLYELWCFRCGFAVV
jgi:hypothetical protein